jgi:hypothetical protein
MRKIGGAANRFGHGTQACSKERDIKLARFAAFEVIRLRISAGKQIRQLFVA